MSVVLQKNCEYFLLEICKPLQCKASEAKISELKPPDRKHLKSSDFGCFLLQKMSFWNAKKIATHTVTHTPKRNNGEKSAGQEICDSCPAFFFCLYMTCSMKAPMVWAASSCFCLVAWV